MFVRMKEIVTPLPSVFYFLRQARDVSNNNNATAQIEKV